MLICQFALSQVELDQVEVQRSPNHSLLNEFHGGPEVTLLFYLSKSTFVRKDSHLACLRWFSQ